MNRETLDGIVKQGLVKISDRVLMELGDSVLSEHPLAAGWVLEEVRKYEQAQSLLRDDARRLEIVDRILKEMKP